MSEATRPAKEATAQGSAAAVVVVMLMITVMLPVLYVLSLGPVIMMIERGGMSTEFWQWFYAPLEWLCEHVDFIRTFVEWYVSLWRS